MAMLIVCQSCSASYVIDPIELGTAVRTVRCSRCKAARIVNGQEARAGVIDIIADLIAKTETRDGGTFSPVRRKAEAAFVQPSSLVRNTYDSVDRRSVSMQRYSGIILAGIALITGVSIIVLDNAANKLSFPKEIKVSLRGTLGDIENFRTFRESGGPQLVEEINASRQVLGLST